MTLDRTRLAELTPLVRRAADLDPATLVRVRCSTDRLAMLVRLPFGVLAAAHGREPGTDPVDTTVAAGELLAWLQDERAGEPVARDAAWRGGTPPDAGWHRIERVPDTELRPLVRTGALTLKEAAEREGVPGAQPRQEVADALLDSVVLTVRDQGHTAEVHPAHAVGADPAGVPRPRLARRDRRHRPLDPRGRRLRHGLRRTSRRRPHPPSAGAFPLEWRGISAPLGDGTRHSRRRGQRSQAAVSAGKAPSSPSGPDASSTSPAGSANGSLPLFSTTVTSPRR